MTSPLEDEGEHIYPDHNRCPDHGNAGAGYEHENKGKGNRQDSRIFYVAARQSEPSDPPQEESGNEKEKAGDDAYVEA